LLSAIRSYAGALLDKSPSTGKTLPELDGLRGLAVLVVIASHCNFLGMKGQGALGVWLFFVLSGFLLTWIFLRTLPGALRPAGLARYMVRRVARILPMYFLVTTAFFAARSKDAEWLWRHLTFRQADGHFWSIPQEEIFYLLLPLLMAGLTLVRRAVPVVPAAVFAIALLALAEATGPPFHLHGNGVLLPFYLEIFLLGFSAAMLWHSLSWRQKPSRVADTVINAATVPVLGVILFTSPAHHELYEAALGFAPPRFGWDFPLRSGIACVLLLLIALRDGSWIQRALSLAPLRIVGVLSFAMYLVHPFVITFSRRSFGLTEGELLFAVSLVASLAIALFLERAVERPCMAFGKRINARYFDSRRG
jgi:peptidoglycan/LPS O-acetylase OafA/YrhL